MHMDTQAYETPPSKQLHRDMYIHSDTLEMVRHIQAHSDIHIQDVHIHRHPQSYTHTHKDSIDKH